MKLKSILKTLSKQVLYSLLILVTFLTANRESVGTAEHEYFGLLLAILFLLHMFGKKFTALFSTSKRGIFNSILIISFTVTVITGIMTATTAVHIVTLRGAASIYTQLIHQYVGYFTIFLIVLHVFDKRHFLQNFFAHSFK